MDMPVNVPVDDPNADTEWNDILRKHGVIPEKPPSPTPIIEEALQDAVKKTHDNRLEDKTLDELDELEDEEDEAFLRKYRQQRMHELSSITKASKFNQVFHLQKPDYSRDVTEASKTAFVLVHMSSSLGTNVESRIVTEIFRQLALKFGDVKFCEIHADLCVEGYPEQNTPTILIYREGDIKRQIVTLKELRGSKTTAQDIVRLLVELGALKENDQRLLDQQPAEHGASKTIRDGSINAGGDDTDDDWD